MTLGLYLRELKRQCSFALIGFERMKQALSRNEKAITWVFERKQEINKMANEEEKQDAFEKWRNEMLETSRSSPRQMQDFWYSVQAFLVSAANVSKFLWPIRPKIPGRGEFFRGILGVSDNSPIASRSFRDSYEHFDERLDEWVNLSVRHNFMDEYIGSLNQVKGLEEGDIMRTYDPGTGVLTFRGEKFELQPIVQELGRIAKTADRIEQTIDYARSMRPP